MRSRRWTSRSVSIWTTDRTPLIHRAYVHAADRAQLDPLATIIERSRDGCALNLKSESGRMDPPLVEPMEWRAHALEFGRDQGQRWLRSDATKEDGHDDSNATSASMDL